MKNLQQDVTKITDNLFKKVELLYQGFKCYKTVKCKRMKYLFRFTSNYDLIEILIKLYF